MGWRYILTAVGFTTARAFGARLLLFLWLWLLFHDGAVSLARGGGCCCWAVVVVVVFVAVVLIVVVRRAVVGGLVFAARFGLCLSAVACFARTV